MRPEFEEHVKKVIDLEGGYKLHRNPGEQGDTYAGIYRKAHPSWEGWKYIDASLPVPENMVKDFYYENFYKPLEGIENPKVRFIIFDFAVTAGVRKAVSVVQAIIGTKIDGIPGPETFAKINELDYNDFIKTFLLARIWYYLNIVNSNPLKYGQFLRGWLNRVFIGAEYVQY